MTVQIFMHSCDQVPENPIRLPGVKKVIVDAAQVRFDSPEAAYVSSRVLVMVVKVLRETRVRPR